MGTFDGRIFGQMAAAITYYLWLSGQWDCNGFLVALIIVGLVLVDWTTITLSK